MQDTLKFLCQEDLYINNRCYPREERLYCTILVLKSRYIVANVKRTIYIYYYVCFFFPLKKDTNPLNPLIANKNLKMYKEENEFCNFDIIKYSKFTKFEIIYIYIYERLLNNETRKSYTQVEFNYPTFILKKRCPRRFFLSPMGTIIQQ